MNPPLANCGPAVQKSMREKGPLTWTLRMGAACDTAQKSAEVRQPERPVVLMVRFERERQKLTRATQLLPPAPASRHRLYTSTCPLMVTSAGDAPRPATWV